MKYTSICPNCRRDDEGVFVLYGEEVKSLKTFIEEGFFYDGGEIRLNTDPLYFCKRCKLGYNPVKIKEVKQE